MNKTFLRFALIGCVGFICDICAFSLMLKTDEVSLNEARICAFYFAATVTWLGNRKVTFVSCDIPFLIQWLRFIAAATVSAVPNFIVFNTILHFWNNEMLAPLLAFCCGVLVGLISNYTLCRRWVFKHTS